MKTLKSSAVDQDGSILVEVLISAVLLLMVAGGVFGAFDASTRSTSEERHRARAHSLAEADLSRMRSMRISALNNLNQTSTVTQDGTPYTVQSTSQYLTDATGTQSCDSGVASADYIQVTSTVTWPTVGSRPPVTATTLIAPPNGSVSPNSGALAIGVEDSRNVGIAGVGISGSGAGSFSGTTGSNGCAIFANLAAGNYTVSFSGIASGKIDKDGNPPGPVATSVVAESTNTLVVQYDNPGSTTATFTTKPYGATSGTTPVASTADSLVVFNSGMNTFRRFGTAGTRVSSINATSLFPFESDYSIYAGVCEGNNPNPSDLEPPPFPTALSSTIIPVGGSPSPAPVIQLPALHLNVYQGSTTGSAKQNGATVRISDMSCVDEPTTGFKRTATTNSNGQLADPGLPYSVYQVCASATVSGTLRRNWVRTTASGNPIENIGVNNATSLSTGVVKNIFLTGTGNNSGSTCP